MTEKLVRDKIPEIIMASGEIPVTRVLSDQDYLDALEDKLQEELDEYVASKELVELADLQETIRALAVARGSSPAELEQLRSEKFDERGGFAGRIALEIRDH